jgi:ArsR family transcriptional regulator
MRIKNIFLNRLDRRHRRPYICTMTQTNNNVGILCSPGEACCSGLAQMLSPKLFKALGDPSRVGLLIRLAEAGGPCTVSDVAKGGNVDISVVSRHLAILREAGIIQCVKQGKEVMCTVQTDRLAGVLRDLADALEQCCPAKAPKKK